MSGVTFGGPMSHWDVPYHFRRLVSPWDIQCHLQTSNMTLERPSSPSDYYMTFRHPMSPLDVPYHLETSHITFRRPIWPWDLPCQTSHIILRRPMSPSDIPYDLDMSHITFRRLMSPSTADIPTGAVSCAIIVTSRSPHVKRSDRKLLWYYDFTFHMMNLPRYDHWALCLQNCSFRYITVYKDLFILCSFFTTTPCFV